MKASEMFYIMPRSIVHDILDYTFNHDKEVYQVVLGSVAQARKVRPIYLQRQPRNERFAAMADSLSRPALENAADNLIRNWLLKKHASLLTEFLDGLKITHNKGMVDSLPDAVDDAALQMTIEAILAKYSHDVVAVYLNAFNYMNGTRWPNLDLMLQSEPRLQLNPDN